jgi:hypothetical protein
MNAPVTAWVAPGDIQPADEHGVDAVRYKRGDLVDRLIELGVEMGAEIRDMADTMGRMNSDNAAAAQALEQLVDDFDTIVRRLDGGVLLHSRVWTCETVRHA